ncbi:MAG: aminotransferase class IV family protein [Anaerolinea sp.]|nr:aminotransferase class IV family protein [Anaerolinea sp.]
MPCTIRLLTPDGLQPVPYTADSLNDAAQYEPQDGVYTVTNTFDTYTVLKLTAHLDRLEDSARRASIPLKLDRPRLRAALREVITLAGCGDVRFRITVPADQPDHYILSVEPFKPLAAAIIENGVRVITVPDSARVNAAAKTTGWMHERQKLESSLPAGIYTALLLDENGQILEGVSSNFYAIMEDALWTADAGALPGIALQIVLEVAPDVLPVKRDAVNVSAVPRLAEAFITSASRGIVPVIEIDGHTLGDGKPGALTRQLRERYTAAMQKYLETL